MQRLTLRLAVVALLALCLASPAAPVGAQHFTALPPLAELTSVRVDYVSTFNGEPGIVCQDEWASASRYHSTCIDLVSAQYPEFNIDVVAGRVTEFVYYDGTAYIRFNDEPSWAAAVDPTFDPSFTLNERLFYRYLYPQNAAITNVGRATVGGLAATQYQFWSLDPELNEASGGQFVYDVFVSDLGFALKDQESWRGSFPMGDGELALIWTYKDFNAPVVVAPPAPDSVRPASLDQLQLPPSLLHR